MQRKRGKNKNGSGTKKETNRKSSFKNPFVNFSRHRAASKPTVFLEQSTSIPEDNPDSPSPSPEGYIEIYLTYKSKRGKKKKMLLDTISREELEAPATESSTDSDESKAKDPFDEKLEELYFDLSDEYYENYQKLFIYFRENTKLYNEIKQDLEDPILKKYYHSAKEFSDEFSLELAKTNLSNAESQYKSLRELGIKFQKQVIRFYIAYMLLDVIKIPEEALKNLPTILDRLPLKKLNKLFEFQKQIHEIQLSLSPPETLKEESILVKITAINEKLTQIMTKLLTCNKKTFFKQYKQAQKDLKNLASEIDIIKTAYREHEQAEHQKAKRSLAKFGERNVKVTDFFSTSAARLVSPREEETSTSKNKDDDYSLPKTSPHTTSSSALSSARSMSRSSSTPRILDSPHEPEEQEPPSHPKSSRGK